MIQEFLNQSAYYMELNLPRIKNCLELLSEEEIWQRPNLSSNSIGNLILHLCGNITQYIISGLAGAQDNRQREVEFSVLGGVSKQELLDKLDIVVSASAKIIRNLDSQLLHQHKKVQGLELSGFAIIIHVTEHFSYHTGQIAFWTKLLKDTDLGFYKGRDLNIKN
jgi:uncharacterized damage-inducible protein DinB